MLYRATAPHRTVPHRTAPHHTAPHRTAVSPPPPSLFASLRFAHSPELVENVLPRDGPRPALRALLQPGQTFTRGVLARVLPPEELARRGEGEGRAETSRDMRRRRSSARTGSKPDRRQEKCAGGEEGREGRGASVSAGQGVAAMNLLRSSHQHGFLDVHSLQTPSQQQRGHRITKRTQPVRGIKSRDALHFDE